MKSFSLRVRISILSILVGFLALGAGCTDDADGVGFEMNGFDAKISKEHDVAGRLVDGTLTIQPKVASSEGEESYKWQIEDGHGNIESGQNSIKVVIGLPIVHGGFCPVVVGLEVSRDGELLEEASYEYKGTDGSWTFCD
ncbi:MAG: hypothetical protein GY854_01310 [Deltaproteobacteria bacterium]|nr:hypothetical protein [Deltaproteobacteria bacterium]